MERAAEELLRLRYPDRPLRANVEFYTAVLLDAVGLALKPFGDTQRQVLQARWGHAASAKPASAN